MIDKPTEITPEDTDIDKITKGEAYDLLSSGVPAQEVYDTYPTSFTVGQLRAFKAHVTTGM